MLDRYTLVVKGVHLLIMYCLQVALVQNSDLASESVRLDIKSLIIVKRHISKADDYISYTENYHMWAFHVPLTIFLNDANAFLVHCRG